MKLTETRIDKVISETLRTVINEMANDNIPQGDIISPKVIKKWEKFNADLNAFYEYSGTDCIYEDAYTTRYVKDFSLTPDGVLRYVEDNYQNEENLYDDDDALDWLKDFRKWLNKAKRYFAMDAEVLDKIQDGEAEDIE